MAMSWSATRGDVDVFLRDTVTKEPFKCLPFPS